VILADRIPVRPITGYTHFHVRFSPGVVLPIELENETCYTAYVTEEIDDTELLLADRAWQVQRQQEDIDTDIQSPKQSRDVNIRYFGPIANLRTVHLQIGGFTLLHDIELEQSHGAKLDAR
jgi:hypothetical protein